MMRNSLRKNILIIMIVLLTMTGSAAAQGIELREENQFGDPGLSFRYVDTLGITGVPYISDTIHLNRPTGLFIDKNDNVYVTEESGTRLLKYDNNGENLLSIGVAGVDATDQYNFYAIKDVVVDNELNIWVADWHRVVQYDQNGEFIQEFPANDSWQSGNTNERFDDVGGIAIDNDKLYVSDSKNHRIQIFDVSGEYPVYSTTIGVTGEMSNDVGKFNSPSRVALDANGNLFVVDTGNNRVQLCEMNGVWSCSIFEDNLNNPLGIAVHGDDVYIADTYNWRILKCSGDICHHFNSEGDEFIDVAIDSKGDVYASSPYRSTVLKFDDAGEAEIVIGEAFVPYLTDEFHFNSPRVVIDHSDNIVVIEEGGQRLLKYNPQGDYLWSVGTPGVTGNTNHQFNYPHAVAVDQSDNIYVADGWRVQIFNSSGNYLGTLMDEGGLPFDWLTGIAVDDEGNILIVDAPKHIVKIFDADYDYLFSIGDIGKCGSNNDQFCWPIGITVDQFGNVFVADNGNARFQKFDKDYQWIMTLGTIGSRGNSFFEFSNPEGVAVDAEGRIYAVDMWENMRVQVYDEVGAYLTTIGGEWGESSSQFRGISSASINSAGDVFISDFKNGRIQIFSPGIPDWTQVNINGFGVSTITFMSSLVEFNGQLYAGTGDWDQGGQIWRSSDGVNWTAVNQPGFGDAANSVIISMIVFEGQLYASTGWGGGVGQVWRSSDGENWVSVVPDGFGNLNNFSINRFVVFDDVLYASTGNGADGAEIWRSVTGNTDSWTPVVQGGNGNSNNNHVNSFVLFDGYLYAAGENWVDGAQVWRTSNGESWTVVSTNGFGNANNIHIGSIIEFNGMLYASTRNDVTGAEIFRSSNGTTWTKVIGSGISDPGNYKFESLFVFNDQLFVTANNDVTGLKVWHSDDGTTFTQLIDDGFGDSNNRSTLWNSAMIEYENHLYIGTHNGANGGELWRFDIKSDSGFDVFLPLILK